MKKVIVILLSAFILLTATACENENSTIAQESESSIVASTEDLSQYEIIEENGSLTLKITEFTDDGFKAMNDVPDSREDEYTVICSSADKKELCVEDYVGFEYEKLYKAEDGVYIAVSKEGSFYVSGPVSKPVIYLYPEEKTEVSVELDFNGTLMATYPEYNNGWQVTAMPDGTLFDKDGNEYSYIFWDGISSIEYDFSKGFCVKGEDTAEFLRESLKKLGLTPREYNEFIVYWLPLMQSNKYNVISFQTDRYTDNALLNVTPSPDTVIRVYMAYYGSDEYVDIPPQELSAPERDGFTLIEWGGSKVRK